MSADQTTENLSQEELDIGGAVDSLNFLLTELFPYLATQAINRVLAFYWTPFVFEFITSASADSAA
jgi:methionine salvage enolase-phosphatase E1